METQQPAWNLVAQMGDIHPIEYGGKFVYEDATGVYSPEIEVLEEPATDGGKTWTVSRFICEPCTFVNGILSDNKYYPESAAWFANKLNEIADYGGVPVETLISSFTSGSTVDRAAAWIMLAGYVGLYELDQYPLKLTLEEVEARYSAELSA